MMKISRGLDQFVPLSKLATVQGFTKSQQGIYPRISYPPRSKLADPACRNDVPGGIRQFGIGCLAGQKPASQAIDVIGDVHAVKTSRKLLEDQAAHCLVYVPGFGYMKKSPKAILAENIKRLRETKGWSQMDLARHSGVKQRTISAIENAVHNTGIENLDSLGKAFGVPHWALLLEGLDPFAFTQHGLNEIVATYIALPDEGKEEIKHGIARERRYSPCNSTATPLPHPHAGKP